PASVARLERLERDLADREEELTALNARWERERGGLNRVGELKKRLDEAHAELERAQRDADWEKASRLQYQEIPALEHELADAAEVEEEKTAPPVVKDEAA